MNRIAKKSTLDLSRTTAAKTAARQSFSEPREVRIPEPNIQGIRIKIRGTAPLMLNRFSNKALEKMRQAQVEGDINKKRKSRDPKDFDAAFQAARHISEEGWDGIPASAFRNAMISACRIVGFTMTLAKLSVFVEADGFDRQDGTPLVRIIGPAPEKSELPARNANGGMDIRARPMWRQWSAEVRVNYAASQFSPIDVINLMMHAGAQVGIGEGRHDSRKSTGMGLGTFSVEA